MSDDNDRLEFVHQGWVSLLILDQNCTIRAANQAADKLAGAAPGTLVGRRFCEMFVAGMCMTVDSHLCPFLNVRHGRERREQPRWLPITVRGIRTSALVGARSTPVVPRKDGKPNKDKVTLVTMVPSSVVDEADRKRREMVGAAIHDMRHPLTMLSITVEMLAESAAGGSRQLSNEVLRRLQRATAQLTTDVDDLQNRLLFDAGVIKVEPRPVDVVPLVTQLVWQLEPLLSRRKQRISVALPESLVLWADPSALNQILGNLLINAHKYSTIGDSIEVSARRIPGRDQIEIRVRDHGLGIPRDERRRVFERFYRGQDTVGIQGAGLGLAIVKSLIESHGGKVGVSAPRGGGALFWVRLSTATADPQSSSEEAAILTKP
jgi:signal transduction histidine kinase